MARGPTSGSNHFTGSPLNAYPFSVAFWFRLDSTGTAQNLWTLNEPSADRFSVGLSGSPLVLRTTTINFTVNSGTASTGVGLSADRWYHAAAVHGSASSRIAYLDGGNKGSNTTTVNGNMALLNETQLGAFRTVAGAPNTIFAEYGLWNVALTDAEIASLGKGFSVPLIRRGSLVQYMPLVRGSQDLRGNMAETGTVGVGYSHPPIIGAIAA